MPSNFALKIHALLCRPYVKGRDWYDLTWYTRQKVQPNLPHLEAALRQVGPWQGQKLKLTATWVVDRLSEKIREIDWKKAAGDVERFLGPAERKSLSLWSTRFFESKAASLAG